MTTQPVAHLDAKAAAPDPRTPVVALVGAQLDGPRGPVFGPITASSDRPITVVHGSRGSGRTSLLLCIAGRMRVSAGSVRTLGTDRLAETRRRTGIAGFDAIDALESNVTVGDIIRERVSWALPWFRRTPRITESLAAELLAPAFGDHPIPTVGTLVYELDPAAELLLRIALALLEEPELLILDDFDALRDPADREVVAGRLSQLAARGIRSVLATSDPGDIRRFAELDPAVISL